MLSHALQLIARLDDPLFDHTEVEAGPLALQEPPYHVSPIEPNAESR